MKSAPRLRLGVKPHLLFLAGISGWSIAVFMPIRSAAAEGGIDFNRDVRPILSENCFKCHGPDESAREAKLRLDLREAALRPAKSGATAILPGDPAHSEMILRIALGEDDADAMPPPETGK